MKIELNEGMKKCHQDNGFMDQFLHILLLHQQQGYCGEGLGIFYHPYPYLLISLKDLRGIVWSSKISSVINILCVPIILLSFNPQLFHFSRK
jgi:hypothetical protein